MHWPPRQPASTPGQMTGQSACGTLRCCYRKAKSNSYASCLATGKQSTRSQSTPTILFHPHGTRQSRFVCEYHSYSTDCSQIWSIDSDTVRCLQELKQHEDSVGPLLIYGNHMMSPLYNSCNRGAGNYFYSGGWDAAIKCWTLPGPDSPVRLVSEVEGHSGNVYSLSAADGCLFSGVSYDNTTPTRAYSHRLDGCDDSRVGRV